MHAGRNTRRLTLAIWFGGGVILAAVAAPAAFQHATNSQVAGDIVGAMFARWHWISVVAPAILLAPPFGRRGPARRLWLVIATFALLAAALQWATDTRVSAMRKRSPVPVRSLAPDDPFRRRFGALHGVAFGLMGVQLLLAGVLVILDVREDDE